MGGLGGTLAIGSIGFVAFKSGHPWVLGSFGASCVLLFGFPDAPFSQPRNVIAGHLLSSSVGLLMLHFLGPAWWSMAAAAGLAITVMMLTDTVHPPAGSNPVIVFLTQPDFSFLVLPTLFGTWILLAVAYVFLKYTHPSAYPKYWLSPRHSKQPNP